MALPSFDKKPGEQYPITFNYFGKLPRKTRIVAAEVSAVDVDAPATDVSDDVLQSTTASVVNGLEVRVGVKGGEVGHSYKITVTAKLSSALNDNLNDEVVMKVVA